MQKDRVKEIVKQAKQLNTYQEKLDFLHNKFDGETCYILGCGPSILDADQGKLNIELAGNICLSLKIVYFEFKDLVDFHFFNCNNFKEYPYEDKTFIISQSDFCGEQEAKTGVWGSQEYDLSVMVDRQLKSETLTKTKNFEKWLFSNSKLQRPWGPGIMYETAMFFAYHLGCKEIKTIGWDYKDATNKQNISHFYKEEWRISKLRNPANQPHEGEIQESIDLSGEFCDFLTKEGVTLKAMKSDKCFLSNKIKRFTI